MAERGRSGSGGRKAAKVERPAVKRGRSAARPATFTLWRISSHATLDGAGGLEVGGRWHSAGHRIAYCATSPAGALLEILVHQELQPYDLPARYRLLRIEGPGGLSSDRIADEQLVSAWRDRPHLTQALGDAWLESGRTLLLEVPSAIVPATVNFLVNPLHREASRLRTVATFHAVLDPRLAR